MKYVLSLLLVLAITSAASAHRPFARFYYGEYPLIQRHCDTVTSRIYHREVIRVKRAPIYHRWYLGKNVARFRANPQ